MSGNTKPPLELHKAVLEGFQTLSVEEAAKIISEDLVLDESSTLPFGGLYRGPAGFVQLMKNVQATCPDFNFELDLMLTDGEANLLFQGRMSANTPGGFLTMPVMERWRFENDKAVEIIVCWHDVKKAAEMMTAKAAA